MATSGYSNRMLEKSIPFGVIVNYVICPYRPGVDGRQLLLGGM